SATSSSRRRSAGRWGSCSRGWRTCPRRAAGACAPVSVTGCDGMSFRTTSESPAKPERGLTMRIKPAQRTLRGQAYEILKRQLRAGELAPGERVNEVVMAAQLGISRGPLREAIRTLEQEGLLTALPQRGVFVRQLSQEEAGELQEVR